MRKFRMQMQSLTGKWENLLGTIVLSGLQHPSLKTYKLKCFNESILIYRFLTTTAMTKHKKVDVVTLHIVLP